MILNEPVFATRRERNQLFAELKQLITECSCLGEMNTVWKERKADFDRIKEDDEQEKDRFGAIDAYNELMRIWDEQEALIAKFNNKDDLPWN